MCIYRSPSINLTDARYLMPKYEITVETQSGLVVLRLEDDGHVTANMGAPVFDAARLSFSGSTGAVSEVLDASDEA